MKQLVRLQQLHERHGDVFPLRTANGPQLVVVASPELAKRVFNAPADVLRAGEGNRRVLGRLLGSGSPIMLDGERHISHRRLLLPAFHGPRLQRRAQAIRALIESQLDTWPLGEELAVLPRLRGLALTVVMRAIFDSDEGQRFRDLHDSLAGLLLLAGARHDTAPVPADSLRRAEALIGEEVARRRHGARPTGEQDDVLSLLLAAGLEDGSALSDEDIRDELMTLVIAGTDTTAGSLAWVLERPARQSGSRTAHRCRGYGRRRCLYRRRHLRDATYAPCGADVSAPGRPPIHARRA